MKKASLIPAAAVALSIATLPAHAAFAGGATLPNGFTAAVVAHSGEIIQGTVDATGFDVGIYVGPGVHDVTIAGATVKNANDQGILMQDASNVLIRDNTVEDNAANHPASLSEVKGIVLAGTNHVSVIGNTVKDNGDGGIGIYDDGPSSPFAPVATDGVPVASTDNLVSRNLIDENLNGCGIVVSEKDTNGEVANNVVSFNTILGVGADPSDPNPGVGGIIVAGGTFGNGTVTGTVVLQNTVIGGFIPGISIHGSNGALMTGTQLISNTLEDNGAGAANTATGIELAGAPGTIMKTQVLNDNVAGDSIGVFHVGDQATHISKLSTSPGTTPVAP